MSIKEKILDRSAVIGVLGLGYVGLPLAMEFARKGFSVVGFDVDSDRVRSLARGASYVADIPGEALREQLDAGRFRATRRFDGLSRCDAIIICVPTPLRKSKDPDVSFIESACREVGRRLRKGQLVILESTTYPGTTEELVRPMLEHRGERAEEAPGRGASLKAGKDFHLAFSPERVDPSNQRYRIENTPKVVGGLTPACRRAAALLYGQIVAKVVPVSALKAAEMVKLLENTFRAVNIGLVNEMALICDRLKLDVWEIVEAAATKPFGFMPFYPGPGLGGHCIPVDPSYLAWKMKELNFEAHFIELATQINGHMPEYVVGRIARLLNGRGKPIRGSRVLVLGVAYKAEVSDVRESPALDVINLLMEEGGKVAYHDPFVPAVAVRGGKLRSRPLSSAALRSADLVVILTAHRALDYAKVISTARAVFDTRNATAGIGRRNVQRL